MRPRRETGAKSRKLRRHSRPGSGPAAAGRCSGRSLVKELVPGELERYPRRHHIPNQALLIAVKGFAGDAHIQRRPGGNPGLHELQGVQQAPEVQGLGGDLAGPTFGLKFKEQLAKLLPGLFPQGGKVPGEQPVQVFRADGGHLQHHEPGGQGLVQLPGPGVAVVHGGDEAGAFFHGQAVIAGHVQAAPEVQGGVKHRQGLVPGHVDLVQDAEATQPGALADGTGPENHPPVREGVHADEGGSVHADVEGHVPGGTAKDHGQVFREDVFPRCLAAGEQQVFAAQQGGGGVFPNLLAVVIELRRGDSAPERLRQRVTFLERLNAAQERGADSFFLQKREYRDHSLIQTKNWPGAFETNIVL